VGKSSSCAGTSPAVMCNKKLFEGLVIDHYVNATHCY
jgi:hypothetical protein